MKGAASATPPFGHDRISLRAATADLDVILTDVKSQHSTIWMTIALIGFLHFRPRPTNSTFYYVSSAQVLVLYEAHIAGHLAILIPSSDEQIH